MDLGTGIFLSSALISIVLLYGFTKDLWRWRKIIGGTVAVCAVILLAVIAVIAITQYWEE